MSLVAWSWLFLIVYLVGMLAIGVIGQRRVKHADDFATARASYGPLFLAFAFAATTASGATFLGLSGFGYEYGLVTLWGAFLYPLGVYFGVLIAMRLIASSGNRFGNRSIPEFLGDRYQSDGIRVMVSVLSCAQTSPRHTSEQERRRRRQDPGGLTCRRSCCPTGGSNPSASSCTWVTTCR